MWPDPSLLPKRLQASKVLQSSPYSYGQRPCNCFILFVLQGSTCMCWLGSVSLMHYLLLGHRKDYALPKQRLLHCITDIITHVHIPVKCHLTRSVSNFWAYLKCVPLNMEHTLSYAELCCSYWGFFLYPCRVHG